MNNPVEAIKALAADLRHFASALYQGGVAGIEADPMHAQILAWASRIDALAASLDGQGEAEVVDRQFRWRVPGGRDWSPWQTVDGDTDAEVLACIRTPAYWNALSKEDAAKAVCEFRNLYASPPPSRDAAPVVGEDAKDAARYRWIRDADNIPMTFGEEFDQMVDAYMAADLATRGQQS
jgi:hypothetical protein